MSSFTKTVTDKQLAANQANGALSHGPSTPEGKAVSSKNALKHGLCAPFYVLPGESQKMFNELFERFVEDEKPVGSAEVELVRKMAEYTWLRERASRFMAGCYEVPGPTPEEYEAGKALVHVSNQLDRYMRHHAHMNREYARASAELLKRRQERELRENRFVLEKRAEGEESRREKRQNQRDETHKVRQATAEIKRQHAEVRLWKEFDPPAPPKFQKSAA